MAGRTSTDFAAFAYHGGALDVARRLAPDAARPWIDLSTGINPHAYPLPDLAPDVWTRLPGGRALAELEAAAARRYGVTPEIVVAGPGSQALIQTLARIFSRGVAGVLGPTYGGHAEAFAAAGARVATKTALEDLADCNVAIVVNPNNPDGRIARRDDLLELHARLGPAADCSSSTRPSPISTARKAWRLVLPAGAVVLRSFGKTFGLAGLRLGFALASPDISERLRAALGPWPVSGPAIAIGARALDDLAWTDAMAARLASEAARLDALLTQCGWRIVGGTRLFRLAARRDAGTAFERLLAAGILTRPFADAPDRLRFGIPGEEADWERLAAALRRRDREAVHRPSLSSPSAGVTRFHADSRSPRLHHSPGRAVPADARPRPHRWRADPRLSRRGRAAGAGRPPPSTCRRSAPQPRSPRRFWPRAGARASFCRASRRSAPSSPTMRRSSSSRPANRRRAPDCRPRSASSCAATRSPSSSAPGARRCAARSAGPTPTGSFSTAASRRSSPRPRPKPMRSPAISRR